MHDSCGEFETHEMTDLGESWKSAIERPVDNQTQHLAFGGNYRLDVAKALKAGWKATVLCFKAKKIILMGGDLVEIAGIGVDVFSLVTATLDAVRQRMNALEYVGAFVLAGADKPLTRTQFKETLSRFLADANVLKRPWYSGLSDALIESAGQLAADDQDYTELLSTMRRHGWLADEDGLLAFRPQHFTWGLQRG